MSDAVSAAVSAAAPLTLSPDLSARIAREAAASGYESPEDYLAAVLDAPAESPGPVETIDTPRGPVNAHGPVPEEQREAFLGMLADRLEGPAIPWEEAARDIRERLVALEARRAADREAARREAA